MSSELVIIDQNGSIYYNSSLLKSVNNADKLKSLIKYFLYNENCMYYFHYNKTESRFLLLYSKLNYYLKDNYTEAVLDMLFDTENYINNFLKKDIKEKEYLYNDHIYYALSVLIVLIYFSQDFKKYTKADTINKEISESLAKVFESLKNIKG